MVREGERETGGGGGGLWEKTGLETCYHLARGGWLRIPEKLVPLEALTDTRKRPADYFKLFLLLLRRWKGTLMKLIAFINVLVCPQAYLST